MSLNYCEGSWRAAEWESCGTARSRERTVPVPRPRSSGVRITAFARNRHRETIKR